MKKYMIISGFVVILILVIIIFRLFNGGEDSWIKSKDGIYVKHGYPANKPDYVVRQEEVISKALDLYRKDKGIINFSSQCLGAVDSYAVDIVHVPRTAEDNLPENQCSDFMTGKVSGFVELDKDGNVVKIYSSS